MPLLQSRNIKLKFLQPNTGQVSGLPKNPRFIKDDKYQKLKESIIADPEMLELRELIIYPFGDNFVVIAGNMRLQVLLELEYTEAPCKILSMETPIEKLKAITIKDNVSFGQHDFDLLLSDEWTKEVLQSWGVDIPDFNFENETDGIAKINKPGATSDDYSVFELIMQHSNKLIFMETLNNIKITYELDKQEDALMYMVNHFNNNNK